MRALRWHGRQDIRMDDVEAPEPGPGQVLVRVAYAGLCGTDFGEVDHGPTMIRETAHPLTGQAPPITLGHEFSGTIVAVGEEVTTHGVGQRVTADACLRCGVCQWCRTGEYHICARGGSIGLSSDGGFASLVAVPAENAVPIPDAVSLQHAAVAEPLAVGLHAVTRGGVRAGDTVLVIGGGPIGYAAVLAAVLNGAAQVFVSEPLAARAQLVRQAGATEVFDPTSVDVRREVFLRTGRIGPDVVIEATGRADQYPLAVTSVRRGGTVVLAGVGEVDVSVDLRQIVFFERTIRGALGYNFDIERVLALMAAGRLDPSPMITSSITLEDAPRVLRSSPADRATQIKILIELDGE